MVKVKICGITNLEDAEDAVIAGCDALGFVFYRKSPRYIAPEKAAAIIKLLPRRVKKTGVFVNAEEKAVKAVAEKCRLDLLQFHGDETPEFCLRFKGYKVIKAFRVKDKINLAEIAKYRVFAYLFDTFSKTKFGGSGKRFAWKSLQRKSGIKKTVFLSGGLNAGNIGRAIRMVQPEWVDVSSSVEASPGRKDCRKVLRFIDAAKG